MFKMHGQLTTNICRLSIKLSVSVRGFVLNQHTCARALLWFRVARAAVMTLRGREGARTLTFQMQLHMNDPDVGLKAGQVTVLPKTGKFYLSQELFLEIFGREASV